MAQTRLRSAAFTSGRKSPLRCSQPGFLGEKGPCFRSSGIMEEAHSSVLTHQLSCSREKIRNGGLNADLGAWQRTFTLDTNWKLMRFY